MTDLRTDVAHVARVAERDSGTTNSSLKVTEGWKMRGIYAGQIEMTSGVCVTDSQTRTVVHCGQATGHTGHTCHGLATRSTAANGSLTASSGNALGSTRPGDLMETLPISATPWRSR